ncbi:MAG: cell division protein SepF [Acholeplasmataceae bacterium]|jgi:cell division inhibitor SepF
MCFKLFRRKKKEQLSEDIFVPETKSIVSFIQLENSTDETLTKIGEDIKKGIPHILNFELLEIDEANKAMAFLSGVVFAIEGEIYVFRSGNHYMFADNKVYQDGTMEELIREIEGY